MVSFCFVSFDGSEVISSGHGEWKLIDICSAEVRETVGIVGGWYKIGGWMMLNNQQQKTTNKPHFWLRIFKICKEPDSAEFQDPGWERQSFGIRSYRAEVWSGSLVSGGYWDHFSVYLELDSRKGDFRQCTRSCWNTLITAVPTIYCSCTSAVHGSFILLDALCRWCLTFNRNSTSHTYWSHPIARSGRNPCLRRQQLGRWFVWWQVAVYDHRVQGQEDLTNVIDVSMCHCFLD